MPSRSSPSGCAAEELAPRAAGRRPPPARGPPNVEQAEIEREEAAEIYGEEAEEEVEAVKAATPVQRRPKGWALSGGCPPRPTRRGRAPSRKRKLVWVAAEGAGSGPNSLKPGETVPRDPAVATRSIAGGVLVQVPAVLHVRPLRRARIPDGRAAAQAHPARVTPDPAEQRSEAPANTPLKAPASGAVQARVLHRAREPHLRPDPRRRPARRRRPESWSLRVAVAARVQDERIWS